MPAVRISPGLLAAQAIPSAGACSPRTSRYRIIKEIGISEAQLSLLMAGKSGFSIDSLEKICDFLDLEIMIHPKAKRRTKGKK